MVRSGLRGAQLAGAAILAIAALQDWRCYRVEVSPTDPAIYLGVCAGLALAAVFACWIPARRAARVNPIITLRAE